MDIATLSNQPIAPAQIVDTPAQVEVTPVVAQPEIDLITKVTQFKKQSAPVQATNTDGVVLDQKMIDSITDPRLKEAAINFHKSVQADYTRKTQSVADSRKQVETQLAEMQTWTPEKIQKFLLNNPSFVQSAQQVAGTMSPQIPNNGGLTDEQYSALTDTEKAQLNSLKSEINSLKQVNYQALVAQTDNQLKTKYGNYDSQEVDSAIARLAQMNPNELREYVFKAIKHDDNVRNAYEYAKQERSELNQTRVNAMSVDGTVVANNDGLPTRQTGQNDSSWFQTLANFRLQQSRKK